MSVGSTTVRVSWVPPPADSRNGVITQYSVAYEAVDGEDRGRHVVDGIGREHSSWDLVGLEKWTEYRVWVRAHTDVGPGPESSPVLVRTDEDGRQRRGTGEGRGRGTGELPATGEDARDSPTGHCRQGRLVPWARQEMSPPDTQGSASRAPLGDSPSSRYRLNGPAWGSGASRTACA